MSFFNKYSAKFAGVIQDKNSPAFTGTDAGVGTGDRTTTTTLGTFTPLPDPFGRGRTTFSLTGEIPTQATFNQSTGTITFASSFGAINQSAQLYNLTVTATEINPNSARTQSVSRSFVLNMTTPFKFRQVVSTTYMVGGYQNGVLWNNCNRTVHSTDTTTNLGDGYIQNFHYKSGASTRTKVHIWNGGFVTAFNMRTESQSNSGSINFSGSNTSTIQDSDFQYAWINGEGCNQNRRWTIASESITADLGNGWSDHSAAIFGETRGIYWGNSGQTQRLIFATEAVANMGYSAGAHGQQKGLSSKDGKGYGGAQGNYNGGNQFRVTNIETESNISTVGKPFGNMGEENYVHGQDKGYCIGTYDGAQNNRSFVLTYATNSGFETGATTQPKGKGGCSSGHCGFRD